MTTLSLYEFIYAKIVAGTKAQLKDACSALGINVKSKDTKEDLYMRLREYQDNVMAEEAEAYIAQEAPTQEAPTQEAPTQEAEEQEAPTQEAEEQEAEEQEAEEQEALETCYLVKTDKGYALEYPYVQLMNCLSDSGEIEKAEVDTMKRVTFKLPKQVFKDEANKYAEAVAYYFYCAKEAQEKAKADAFDEAEKEGSNTFRVNEGIFAMISSMFAGSSPDLLAKAQGLFLAGSTLPVIVGGMKDSLETLHLAFKNLNLKAMKGGKVQYTDVQVQNMNVFRENMKTVLAPFMAGSTTHHSVKFGINEADMLSWLAWCTGHNAKFTMSKPRLEKLLIQFFMAKVKAVPMPKK